MYLNMSDAICTGVKGYEGFINRSKGEVWGKWQFGGITVRHSVPLQNLANMGRLMQCQNLVSAIPFNLHPQYVCDRPQVLYPKLCSQLLFKPLDDLNTWAYNGLVINVDA